MKKILLLFISLMSLTQVSAQFGKMPKFDPKQFQADMEQFITTEAALSPKEAEAFFPVYREMQKKQRILFDQQRRLRHIKPTDEAGCREAIQKSDDCELQLKEIQLQYHKKFMKILPASKVYDVLRAEEKFHRQIFSMNRFRRGGKR